MKPVLLTESIDVHGNKTEVYLVKTLSGYTVKARCGQHLTCRDFSLSDIIKTFNLTGTKYQEHKCSRCEKNIDDNNYTSFLTGEKICYECIEKIRIALNELFWVSQ